MRDDHVEHNSSGCIDYTVDAVIKKEWNKADRDQEDYKYRKMAKVIKAALETNGYVLEGPISLISTESGRKRRIY